MYWSIKGRQWNVYSRDSVHKGIVYEWNWCREVEKCRGWRNKYQAFFIETLRNFWNPPLQRDEKRLQVTGIFPEATAFSGTGNSYVFIIKLLLHHPR